MCWSEISTRMYFDELGAGGGGESGVGALSNEVDISSMIYIARKEGVSVKAGVGMDVFVGTAV